MKLIKWKWWITKEDIKFLNTSEIQDKQDIIEEIEAYHYWDKSKDLYRVTYTFPNGTQEVKEYRYSDYFY